MRLGKTLKENMFAQRYSIWIVIKAKQIKTSVSYHYTRMTKLKRPSTPNADELKFSHILLVGKQNGRNIVGADLQAFKRLNEPIHCDSTISLLGTHSKEIKVQFIRGLIQEFAQKFIHNGKILNMT